MFDHSVIALKIIPDPNLPSEMKEHIFADSNELVRSVQRFIDDLMREHMAATFAKAPVVCYIPCSQCKKMHLSVEKATMKSSIYCPVSRVHADITDYHNILSGLCLAMYCNKLVSLSLSYMVLLCAANFIDEPVPCDESDVSLCVVSGNVEQLAYIATYN